MIRLLLFLAALALAAYGLTWLAENPGQVALTWRGVEYDVSLMVALGVVAGLAILLSLAWGIIRFVFRLPSLVSLAAKARRREKGYAALSRGMVAVGSGDARAASRHAAEARKALGDEPLAKLLRAQAAQLAGDRAGAAAAFREMLDHPQTHALGLRGLHIEARRSGDHEAALQYAMRAHRHAALPWAGQAVLDDRAAHGDWAGALAIVESNAAAKLIDKPTANRWRAVLETAMAQQLAERDAKAALALAQEACALAPGLVPAAALCGRLTAVHGDYRRASKIIEAAYRQTPHPDLAAVYLRLRPGDSAADRLARARALARLAPFDSESQIAVGRAALEARDLAAARAALAPLLAPGAPNGRPSARVCLLMADVEEAAGAEGATREWLARAARAPRDRAWVADGVISDRWAPVSPSGALDAFVWRTPEERLSAPEPPVAPAPTPAEPPALVASSPVESAKPPTPTPAAAPESVAAPKPEPPRGAATIVLLPSTAPDDPGPHDESERKPGFRLFARE
ncbi:MAG: heme biosynthesis HemY N-terminal domain-containing protein [Roseiarcus sp.]|jgi:HemY protein